MSMIRPGVVGIVMVAVCWCGGAVAGPSRAERCEAQKNLAAGAKAECLAREYAKEVQGHAPDFARCEPPLTKAFSMAERQAGPGGCVTEGDAAAIEARVDVCMADIASALAGVPPPACQRFPATGQTTCWAGFQGEISCAGTGQDGDIRAGAVLNYTDNGDGTITDNNTGLMWEKKSDDGSIHDKDTAYTWEDAFAVHIVGLNAAAGFAGHTDWRLPNLKELQSIVNYETFFAPSSGGLAVSPAFNTGCVAACTVLTCSCTTSVSYWSSTTAAFSPGSAWIVFFGTGAVLATPKAFASVPVRARAVRGGL